MLKKQKFRRKKKLQTNKAMLDHPNFRVKEVYKE